MPELIWQMWHRKPRKHDGQAVSKVLPAWMEVTFYGRTRRNRQVTDEDFLIAWLHRVTIVWLQKKTDTLSKRHIFQMATVQHLLRWKDKSGLDLDHHPIPSDHAIMIHCRRHGLFWMFELSITHNRKNRRDCITKFQSYWLKINKPEYW